VERERTTRTMTTTTTTTTKIKTTENDNEDDVDDGILGHPVTADASTDELREDRRRRCTTCRRRSNNCPPCIAVEGSPTTWLVPGVAGVQLPMQRRRRASPRVPGACVLAAALVCSFLPFSLPAA